MGGGAADAGSQFRSRDLFPQAAADLLLGQRKAAGPLGPGDVPDVPSGRVAYADGYGNLKLDPDAGGRPGGDRPDGPGRDRRDRTRGRRSATASFGVAPGKLALAPGSSGWPLPGGGRVEWLELFLRGGNASEAFGRPEPGAEVRVGSRPRA